MFVVDCRKIPCILHESVYASSSFHLGIPVAGEAADDQDDEGGEAILGVPETEGREPAVILQVGEYVYVEDCCSDAPGDNAFDCVCGLDMSLEKRQQERPGGDDNVLVEA